MMKILEFDLNLDQLRENQNRLSELIKSMVHEENEELKRQIESQLNNESVWQEPSLFFYFLGDEKKPFTLEQITAGYLEQDAQLNFTSLSDRNHVIYFPNLGHVRVKSDRPTKTVIDLMRKNIEIDGKIASLEPEWQLTLSPIKIYSHVPAALLSNTELQLVNSIETTSHSNNLNLNRAIELLGTYSPEFCNVITHMVKYLAVFDAVNQNSFASITSHGAIFLNCEGEKQNEMFFVDDISHQAGHVIFNALTLDTQEYFKFPKETPLKNELVGDAETRSIYDAFHGLFTYTCIMHALNKWLKGAKVLDKIVEIELLSRMAFNAGKLHLDLNNLYKQNVFTKKGLEMFDQFVSGYKYISKEYGPMVQDFKFSNQGYTFNITRFLELNNQGQLI